jgi:hypothetical protein
MRDTKANRAASFQANGAEGEAPSESTSIRDRCDDFKTVSLSPLIELLDILADIQRKAEARAEEILREQHHDSRHHVRKKGVSKGRTADGV